MTIPSLLSDEGPDTPGRPAPDGQPFLAFLDELRREIATAGWETTTEEADMAAIRRTPAYGRFRDHYPDLVDRVTSVVTARNGLVSMPHDD